MGSTRTLWTGSLVLGPLTVPVKMITIAESPTKVSFNQAHRCKPGKLTRMQQKRWCPSCRKELSKGEIARVYEHAPDQYLEVMDAEIATCDATPSSLLTITNVLTDGLPALYVESTALLIPDGLPVPFFTFLRALGTSIAVADLVLQKRHQRVCIGALEGSGLVYLLRTTEECKALSEHEIPIEQRPTLRLINIEGLRRELLGLAHPFNGVEDTHSAAVRRMLSKKIETLSKDALTTTLQSRKSKATKKKSARRR